jgi:hypothetical protein
MVHLGDEAQVDANFGMFGDSAIPNARQVAQFALNVRQARKLLWTHPIEYLGELGHVEYHFGPFGEILTIGARLVHGLRQAYHSLQNRFGHT